MGVNSKGPRRSGGWRLRLKEIDSEECSRSASCAQTGEKFPPGYAGWKNGIVAFFHFVIEDIAFHRALTYTWLCAACNTNA